MIRRAILEPIGKVGPGGLNFVQIAQTARLIVTREGRTLVSMDEDQQVYATPIEHPFSHAMLRQYSDRVVGTCSTNSTAGDIQDDLVAQWKSDRQTAA